MNMPTMIGEFSINYEMTTLKSRRIMTNFWSCQIIVNRQLPMIVGMFMIS